MKAKLVKHESGFILYDEDNITIGAEPNVLSSNIFSKLSIKNCQAIERGYDLDELAREITNKEHLLATQYSKGFEKGIIIGFQKALDLMGDKKFSNGQLLNAMDLVWQWMNGEDYGCKTLTEVQDKHIQSLQQTEWDVEIEMEINLNGKNGLDRAKMIPKLDADGCLILKRI